MAKSKGYYSYLLRVWQTGEGPDCTWCASLEQPGTGHQVGFATLDRLFAFLTEQTSPRADQAGAGGMEQAGSGDEPSEASQGRERQGW
ncbi:MAG: hypothetical protein ACK2UC_03155 [Anaerolineae bacterium]|jgi:hypothetical protein